MGSTLIWMRLFALERFLRVQELSLKPLMTVFKNALTNASLESCTRRWEDWSQITLSLSAIKSSNHILGTEPVECSIKLHQCLTTSQTKRSILWSQVMCSQSSPWLTWVLGKTSLGTINGPVPPLTVKDQLSLSTPSSSPKTVSKFWLQELKTPHP